MPPSQATTEVSVVGCGDLKCSEHAHDRTGGGAADVETALTRMVVGFGDFGTPSSWLHRGSIPKVLREIRVMPVGGRICHLMS